MKILVNKNFPDMQRFPSNRKTQIRFPTKIQYRSPLLEYNIRHTKYYLSICNSILYRKRWSIIRKIFLRLCSFKNITGRWVADAHISMRECTCGSKQPIHYHDIHHILSANENNAKWYRIQNVWYFNIYS